MPKMFKRRESGQWRRRCDLANLPQTYIDMEVPKSGCHMETVQIKNAFFTIAGDVLLLKIPSEQRLTMEHGFKVVQCCKSGLRLCKRRSSIMQYHQRFHGLPCHAFFVQQQLTCKAYI